jgi:hypothetical protein
MTGKRILPLLLVSALAVSACATRTVSGPPALAVGPQLSVERFLQAANTRDLASMGRLFGTVDGPLGDTGGTFKCAFKKIGSWFGGESCLKRTDVELRMEAIASVLTHDDYVITRQEQVAGRLGPATRVLVDLTVEGTAVPAVPFVVVRSSDGDWLVEQVDLQKVMARR